MVEISIETISGLLWMMPFGLILFYLSIRMIWESHNILKEVGR